MKIKILLLITLLLPVMALADDSDEKAYEQTSNTEAQYGIILPPYHQSITNVTTNNFLYLTNSISIGTNFMFTNTPSPFAVQPDAWEGIEPTNLVIDTNYTGTIQIGTRFFTVQELQDGLIFLPDTNALILDNKQLTYAPNIYKQVPR